MGCCPIRTLTAVGRGAWHGPTAGHTAHLEQKRSLGGDVVLGLQLGCLMKNELQVMRVTAAGPAGAPAPTERCRATRREESWLPVAKWLPQAAFLSRSHHCKVLCCSINMQSKGLCKALQH